jgi:hypothetical protein
MIDSEDRLLEILFVRDQRQFINKFSKKAKSDYLLNVNKILKEKFEQDIVVPNKIQAFLINYEIKKLIDKAVNVRNRKYCRIIYVNANLNLTSIINTLEFLNQSYLTVKFHARVLDPEDEFETTVPNIVIVK